MAARARNFTGAELGGLIRSATSLALARHIRVGTLAALDERGIADMQVTMDDFDKALCEIKPANGIAEDAFAACSQYPFIAWSLKIDQIQAESAMAVRQVQSGKTSLYTLLLHGTFFAHI